MVGSSRKENVIYRIRGRGSRRGFRRDKEFSFGHITLKLMVRYPGGVIQDTGLYGDKLEVVER